MRNQELRRLREERCLHLRKLEELEVTSSELSKARAKVEDLQAQLRQKTVLQRQLSLEKSSLERSFECEARERERVSMKAEELRWRLSNAASGNENVFLNGLRVREQVQYFSLRQ